MMISSILVDPFSHYMVAYAVGKKANINLNKLRALTLAGMIPDLDAFSILLGMETFRNFHGGPFHSLIFAGVFTLVIAFGFYFLTRENVALWALLGSLLHLALDIPNTLGYERPDDGLYYLWPFTDFRIALQNVIPDPRLWQILIVSVIFAFSLASFLLRAARGEYAWRIWVDERRILKSGEKVS